MSNTFRLRRLTDGDEPLDLIAVKQYLRVDGDDEDQTIAGLISAARQHAEQVTGLALTVSTWELRLDRFPQRTEDVSIRIPRAPVASIASIIYHDIADVEQTLDPSAYEFDGERIAPAFGQRWPAARPGIGKVSITFSVSYDAANPVPVTIVQALYLIVASWFANREDVVVSSGQAQTLPRSAEFLLNMHKISHVGFEVAA